MPEPKQPPSRTLTNATLANRSSEIQQLIRVVFRTKNGQALLKLWEDHYIYNRRFADHRLPNLGFENEGSAEVIRTIRFALTKGTRKNV